MAAVSVVQPGISVFYVRGERQIWHMWRNPNTGSFFNECLGGATDSP